MLAVQPSSPPALPLRPATPAHRLPRVTTPTEPNPPLPSTRPSQPMTTTPPLRPPARPVAPAPPVSALMETETEKWMAQQHAQDRIASIPRPAGPIVPTRPTQPVTSAPPGFTESPWGHRNPLVEVTNLEGDTAMLTLSGPASYRLIIGPFATVSTEVQPGTYAAAMWSDLAPVPNVGWGVFRPFRKYSAFATIGMRDEAAPLRMGELLGPGEPIR